MRTYGGWWIAVGVALAVGASYVIPNLGERLLERQIGPFWSYVVLGDLVGCLAIGALTGWKLGVGLYILLSIVETIAYRTHLVSRVAMMWMADLVPTLILCFLAVIVARVRGGLLPPDWDR